MWPKPKGMSIAEYREELRKRGYDLADEEDFDYKNPLNPKNFGIIINPDAFYKGTHMDPDFAQKVLPESEGEPVEDHKPCVSDTFSKPTSKEGSIWLPYHGIYLSNGFSALGTLFDYRHLNEMLNFYVAFSLDAYDRGSFGEHFPIIFLEDSFNYDFDMMWFLNCWIEYIAVANRVKREMIEPLIVPYFAPRGGQKALNSRFLFIAFLMLRHGLINQRLTLKSRDDYYFKDAFAYEKAGYYFDTLLRSSASNIVVKMRKNTWHGAAFNPHVDPKNIERVRQISEHLKYETVAFGEKKIASYQGEYRPFFLFDLKLIFSRNMDDFGRTL